MLLAMTPAIVTIGNFDGVHLGHQHLIQQMLVRARSQGMRATAVTFDPHPREVLRPDQPVRRLTSTYEKVGLLHLAGLDDVWVCHFAHAIGRLEPTEFLALVGAHWPIGELWVGYDFALGRGRSGSIDVLSRLGREQGFRVRVVPPLVRDGQVVSSSLVRVLLDHDRVDEAAVLLGRRVARPILAA